MKTTKNDKIQFLKQKLATDSRWALRGLQVVFARQTEHEKTVAKTEEDNGVGFSGVDAEFLTSLATQYETRGRLFPKQMVYVYRRMPKYARQILQWTDAHKLEAAMGLTNAQPALLEETK